MYANSDDDDNDTHVETKIGFMPGVIMGLSVPQAIWDDT